VGMEHGFKINLDIMNCIAIEAHSFMCWVLGRADTIRLTETSFYSGKFVKNKQLHFKFDLHLNSYRVRTFKVNKNKTKKSC